MSQVKHSVHIDFKTDIKTLKQAEKELDKLSRALALIEGDSQNLMGNSPEAVAELRKQLEKLQKAYDKAEKEGRHVFDDFNKDTLTAITNLTKLQLKHKSEIDMLEKQQRAADKANKSLEQSGGLLERVKKGMSGALIEGTIFTAFFALTTQISMAVQEAIQFDKTMTRIGIVTGRSVESMKSFAEYSFMASSRLGTTAQKFAEASLTFAQQGGLAQGYSSQLAEASIMLSNITGTSAEDSSEAITAIANSFKMLESDGSKAGMKIADMLAALDASSGSSANEIADAFRRSASSFQAAGFSAAEASAMIATVSETTRQSAEMVGTGFKTMIGNLADLKVGSAETEAYVSKVSKLGEELGVNLSIMNEAGTDIKSVPEILKMVAAAYNEAGTLAQKQAIVEAVAGKEQRDRFIALIENQERYNELLGIAGNSAGAAQSANERYLDSIEAKLNKLKNEWNFFMSNLLNAEWFKAVIDKLTVVLMEINNASDNLPVQLAKIGQLITPWLMIAWAAFRWTAIDSIKKGFEQGTEELKDELDSSSKKIDRAGNEMIRAAGMMQNAANRMVGGAATGGDIVDGNGKNNKNDNNIDGKNNTDGKKSGFLGKMGNVIESGAGKVKSFFGGLIKILGPIGLIVSGIVGIVNSLDVWANDSLSIWEKIGHTLYNLADSLLLGIPSLIGLDSWKDTASSKERVELDRKIKEDDATAKESIRTSGKEVEDLMDVVKKSAIGSEEYTTAANRLGELFPGLVAGVDDLGNSILVSSGIMEDYIKTKQDELRIEQENERKGRVSEAVGVIKAITKDSSVEDKENINIEKNKDFLRDNLYTTGNAIGLSGFSTGTEMVELEQKIKNSDLNEEERLSALKDYTAILESKKDENQNNPRFLELLDNLNNAIKNGDKVLGSISESEIKIIAAKNRDKQASDMAAQTAIVNQAGVKYSSDNLAAAKAGTMLSGENTEKIINSGLLGDKKAVEEFKKALEAAYATVDAEGRALSKKQIQKNIESFVEAYGDIAIKAADEIEDANKVITDKLNSKDFDITKVGYTEFLKQMAEANKMSVDELMKNTNVMSLYADAVSADFQKSKDKVGQLDSITNQIVGNINGFTGSTAQAAFKNAKQTVLNAKNQAAAYKVYVESMMEYSQLMGKFSEFNSSGNGIDQSEAKILRTMASSMKYVKFSGSGYATIPGTQNNNGVSVTKQTGYSVDINTDAFENELEKVGASTGSGTGGGGGGNTKQPPSTSEIINNKIAAQENRIQREREAIQKLMTSLNQMDPVSNETGKVNSSWLKARGKVLQNEKDILAQLKKEESILLSMPDSIKKTEEYKKRLAEVSQQVLDQAQKTRDTEAETTRIISEDRIKGFKLYQDRYAAQAALEAEGSQAQQNYNVKSLEYRNKILGEMNRRIAELTKKGSNKTLEEIEELNNLINATKNYTAETIKAQEQIRLNQLNLNSYGNSSVELINKNKEMLSSFYEVDQNAHEQLINTMQLQLSVSEEIKNATNERYKSELRAIDAVIKRGNLSASELKFLDKKLTFMKEINSIEKKDSMKLVRLSSGKFRYSNASGTSKEEVKSQKLQKAEEYSNKLREDAIATSKRAFDVDQQIKALKAKSSLTNEEKTRLSGLEGLKARLDEDTKRGQQEYTKSLVYSELIAAGKDDLAGKILTASGTDLEQLMKQVPQDIQKRAGEAAQELAIQTDFHIDAVKRNTNALTALTNALKSISGVDKAATGTITSKNDPKKKSSSQGNNNNNNNNPDKNQQNGEPSKTKVPGVVGKLDEKSEKMTLQRRLNKLGESLTVDGDIGPKSKEAIKRFQAKNKLEVDGIAGPKTLAALRIVGKSIDKSLLKFDTGGYTGDSEGIAMLHEKELVLNKMDTENILKAVMALREMPGMIPSAVPAIAGMGPNLNQSVVINASFPGASSSDEIKKAFEALSTKALQYAYKKKSF